MTRRIWLCAALLGTGACLLPARAWAWGANGHRLITNKAVDTLPAELRWFFEANRNTLLQHGTDPLDWLNKSPNERRYHVLLLERYGKFPFDSLPRVYRRALTKFGRARLEGNGLLPWQIGVYSERLTNALRKGKLDEILLNAGLLAHYVAEAHDPFNTTENSDGQLSGQAGVHQRFASSLVDRFSLFFPVRPNDAVYISDPTDHAFEACLNSHSWLEQILLADRRARQGLSDYTDEYFDRFYNQAGAIVIRQLSDAATDVGSYWLTAWRNAGQPSLPSR